MEPNRTPRANRLHIGIFGRRNAGKSSLINALTGQDLAIVSGTPGTTADPVYKSMELHPIGPVVFIDTAGYDDEGELGGLRVRKTADIIRRTDIAVIVIDAEESVTEQDRQWADLIQKSDIPVITVLNKYDKADAEHLDAVTAEASKLSGDAAPIRVSALTGEGIESLREAIQGALPDEYTQERLLGDLIEDESLVLLVMPQDIQAPRGRLILPQVQTIRELLDRKCTVVSTTSDGLDRALNSLKGSPDLIITDSQCFGEVYNKKPEGCPLTSFSILMAASKGDISEFVRGASAIDDALKGSDPFKVLIAEACTHVPLNEDIGTVKIPRLLHKAFGDRVSITSVRGSEFPAADELKKCDLIIHCGACMFNRRHVLSRIDSARHAGTPITNYGVFLAKMAGILDKVCLP